MDSILNVPSVNLRERIPQIVIDALALQIAEYYHPRRIILFGSYANGKPGPESDVDLLVIMKTPLRETEQAIRICQQLDYNFGLDLLVITPQRFSQRLVLGDQFLTDISVNGISLYESPDI